MYSYFFWNRFSLSPLRLLTPRFSFLSSPLSFFLRSLSTSIQVRETVLILTRLKSTFDSWSDVLLRDLLRSVSFSLPLFPFLSVHSPLSHPLPLLHTFLVSSPLFSISLSFTDSFRSFGVFSSMCLSLSLRNPGTFSWVTLLSVVNSPTSRSFHHVLQTKVQKKRGTKGMREGIRMCENEEKKKKETRIERSNKKTKKKMRGKS